MNDYMRRILSVIVMLSAAFQAGARVHLWMPERMIIYP